MKKVLFLVVLAVVAVFTGCKKDEQKNNYPESLEGTVWESNEVATKDDVLAFRLEFTGKTKFRAIIKSSAGMITYNDCNYFYGQGKGTLYVSSISWSIVVNGKTITSQAVQELKSNLLLTGNYTDYQKLVKLESEVERFTGSIKFTVEGNQLKDNEDGGVLYRK